MSDLALLLQHIRSAQLYPENSKHLYTAEEMICKMLKEQQKENKQ